MCVCVRNNCNKKLNQIETHLSVKQSIARVEQEILNFFNTYKNQINGVGDKCCLNMWAVRLKQWSKTNYSTGWGMFVCFLLLHFSVCSQYAYLKVGHIGSKVEKLVLFLALEPVVCLCGVILWNMDEQVSSYVLAQSLKARTKPQNFFFFNPKLV